MGVRILSTEFAGQAVLYCSTTDWAFGPVFHSTETQDAEERAQAFLEWLSRDARQLDDVDLERKYNEWLRETEKETKNG